MWVRGQGRSIVNFDYVTQVEARVQEAAYSTSNSEPKYEVIAYRRPPANDAILLNMLDSKTATAVLDRLGGAIMAEALLVDVMDLLAEVRYDAAQKASAVDRVARVDAGTLVEAPAQATPDQDEAAITAT